MKGVVLNIIFSLFGLSLCQVSYALPEKCLDKSIKSLTTKLDQKSNKNFKYYYQNIIRHTDNTKPTFIIIPGGPGYTSINSYSIDAYVDKNGNSLSHIEWDWNLPSQSNIILTDPRSQGCNAENNIPLSYIYNTQDIAYDILNIIKKEKLTNYILIGRSYGTLLTTQLTYLIEQLDLTPPKAILLTGVIGKALTLKSKIVTLQKVWKELLKELPAIVRKKLPKDFTQITDSDQWVFPLQIEAQTWLNFLQMGLVYQGKNYFEYPVVLPLKIHLLKLQSTDLAPPSSQVPWKNNRVLNELRKHILLYTDLQIPKQSKLYHDIWDNEIESGTKKDQNKLFDSKRYPIQSPIIYLQGSWDILTPLPQALYHYKKQKDKSNKFFIVAKKGGHDLLSTLHDCAEEFWKTINRRNFKHLEQTLKMCDDSLLLLK